MDNGIALKLVLSLAKPLGVASLKKLKKLKPIEEFRIQQAIESSIAEVWDSLSPYFAAEHIVDERRDLIAAACERELRPYADDVRLLLKGSLDGEKLFEQLRAEAPFPQEIQDENLEQVYRMVFPLLASVLCNAPLILEQTQEKGLPEILSRFDLLKDQLSSVSSGIVQVRLEPQREADDLYSRVLQQSLKKVLLGVEVTGLYGDSPLKQAKEEMFVIPAIEEERLDDNEPPEWKHAPPSALTTLDHVEHFLSAERRSIVRGAPGAGKSTWSRWLQVQALREHGLLVIHLRLRSWQEGALPTIVEAVAQLVGQNMAAEVSPAAVARWVGQGRIAAILDGFDEVAPDRRQSMIRSIHDLSEYLQAGPCLVTSRPLFSDNFEALGERWTSSAIRPFDTSRILDYISRWYRHAPLKEGANREIDAAALHDLLTQDPHVRPLTSNPLMLATLLMVHHNDGELPKGRSRLYARYIDGMLGIWDDRQEVHADISGLDREQKKRVLTSLAVALHFEDRDEMGEDETLDLVAESLRSYGYRVDAQTVLNSIRERSGLIAGPGSYSFSHKSVGEYLVARAICDGDRLVKGEKLDRFLLLGQRDSDRWVNVLYFWAGSASVAEVRSFVEALSDSRDLRLRTGLLWDQMDRFHLDWLGAQVRAVLRELDDLAAHEDVSDSSPHYWCFNFKSMNAAKMSESASIRMLELRHVSLPVLDQETLRALLSHIGYTQDEMADLKTAVCYNVVFSTYLEAATDPVTRLSLISNNARWPDWLRNSLVAYLIWDMAVDSTLEQAIATFERYATHSLGSTELWLAGASYCHLKPWNDTRMHGHLRVLAELCGRPWPEEALQLTRRFCALEGGRESRADSSDLLELLMVALSKLGPHHESLVELEVVRSALSELLERRRASLPDGLVLES